MVFIAAAFVKAAVALKKEAKKNSIRNSVIAAPGASSASATGGFSESVSPVTIEPDWWGGDGGSYADQKASFSHPPPNVSPGPPSNSASNRSETPSCISPVNPSAPEKQDPGPTSPVSTLPPEVPQEQPPIVTLESDDEVPPDALISSEHAAGVAAVPNQRPSRTQPTSLRFQPPPAPPGSFRAEMLRAHTAKVEAEQSAHASQSSPVAPVKVVAAPTRPSSNQRKAVTAPKGSFAAATAALQSGPSRKESLGAHSHASGAVASSVAPAASSPVVALDSVTDSDSSPTVQRHKKTVPGSFLEATRNSGEQRLRRTGLTSHPDSDPGPGPGPVPTPRRPSKYSWNAHVQANRK